MQEKRLGYFRSLPACSASKLQRSLTLRRHFRLEGGVSGQGSHEAEGRMRMCLNVLYAQVLPRGPKEGTQQGCQG